MSSVAGTRRSADTMSDAIALSSPSGRMSKRARDAAQKRLAEALFSGMGDMKGTRSEAEKREIHIQSNRSYAKFLRGLAESGMRPRVHAREAARLEAEADAMERGAAL